MRCPKSRFLIQIILFDELELIIFESQGLTLSTASLVFFNYCLGLGSPSQSVGGIYPCNILRLRMRKNCHWNSKLSFIIILVLLCKLTLVRQKENLIYNLLTSSNKIWTVLVPEWNSILYQNVVLSQATKEKSVQNECKRFPFCISSDFICLLSNQFLNFLGLVSWESNDYCKYNMVLWYWSWWVQTDLILSRNCKSLSFKGFHVLFGQGASSNIFVNSNKLSPVFAVLWCSPLFKVILKISYLKFY